MTSYVHLIISLVLSQKVLLICSTNTIMTLKETLSYYSSNQSSVYCTFLDASQAFDRVQYCKLFRILIRRDLPACIVRILATP